MDSEEKKFLDLDMVADQIPRSGDREMFREAVRCYHIGSHRAAVILVWIATADCLKRRVEELATEGDSLAHAAWEVLKKVDGDSKFEQNLIDQSRVCDLLDDYDYQCVTYARNTRSKCAHPGSPIPTAEAVRHILQICAQVVLCRTGYRGRSYIKEVVTVHFDSHFFLPPEGSAESRCANIISRVPPRLWGQFTSVAALERPKAASGTWRRNSIAFFGVLLKLAVDDDIATTIAAGMKGFKIEAPEYFATLVGLDQRMAKFWNAEERKEARSHLTHVSLTKLNPEAIQSWARLCIEDGFETPDTELLFSRVAVLSRHFPDEFLIRRRDDLYKQLALMTETDASAESTAVALRNLFPTALADEVSDDSRRILQQVVVRFVHSDNYRKLVATVSDWRTNLLTQFLELADAVLVECGEDNQDDISPLFEAAAELSRRNPLLIPASFSSAVLRVLRGDLLSEWKAKDSVIGSRFLRELETLLKDFPAEFHALSSSAIPLISPYRSALDGSDADEEA